MMTPVDARRFTMAVCLFNKVPTKVLESERLIHIYFEKTSCSYTHEDFQVVYDSITRELVLKAINQARSGDVFVIGASRNSSRNTVEKIQLELDTYTKDMETWNILNLDITNNYITPRDKFQDKRFFRGLQYKQKGKRK